MATIQDEWAQHSKLLPADVTPDERQYFTRQWLAQRKGELAKMPQQDRQEFIANVRGFASPRQAAINTEQPSAPLLENAYGQVLENPAMNIMRAGNRLRTGKDVPLPEVNTTALPGAGDWTYADSGLPQPTSVGEALGQVPAMTGDFAKNVGGFYAQALGLAGSAAKDAVTGQGNALGKLGTLGALGVRGAVAATDPVRVVEMIPAAMGFKAATAAGPITETGLAAVKAFGQRAAMPTLESAAGEGLGGGIDSAAGQYADTGAVNPYAVLRDTVTEAAVGGVMGAGGVAAGTSRANHQYNNMVPRSVTPDAPTMDGYPINPMQQAGQRAGRAEAQRVVLNEPVPAPGTPARATYDARLDALHQEQLRETVIPDPVGQAAQARLTNQPAGVQPHRALDVILPGQPPTATNANAIPFPAGPGLGNVVGAAPTAGTVGLGASAPAPFVPPAGPAPVPAPVPPPAPPPQPEEPPTPAPANVSPLQRIAAGFKKQGQQKGQSATNPHLDDLDARLAALEAEVDDAAPAAAGRMAAAGPDGSRITNKIPGKPAGGRVNLDATISGKGRQRPPIYNEPEPDLSSLPAFLRGPDAPPADKPAPAPAGPRARPDLGARRMIDAVGPDAKPTYVTNKPKELMGQNPTPQVADLTKQTDERLQNAHRLATTKGSTHPRVQAKVKEIEAELGKRGFAREGGGWSKGAGKPTGARVVNLDGAGQAVADNMYDQLWEDVQAGRTKNSKTGGTDYVLQVAKKVREAGGARTLDEFRALAQDVAQVPRGDDWQAGLRAAVEKHTPKDEAASGDLGRFDKVPQPLKLKAEPKVAPVLTPDEALHRTMLSKNHQDHLAKLDAPAREKFMTNFKQRWVGERPYRLVDVDLAKLNRRKFNVDEAKVKSLMKKPPEDDGNYPIIGSNETASDHKHLILDGNHRVEAALRRGDKTLKAYVADDEVRGLAADEPALDVNRGSQRPARPVPVKERPVGFLREQAFEQEVRDAEAAGHITANQRQELIGQMQTAKRAQTRGDLAAAERLMSEGEQTIDRLLGVEREQDAPEDVNRGSVEEPAAEPAPAAEAKPKKPPTPPKPPKGGKPKPAPKAADLDAEDAALDKMREQMGDFDRLLEEAKAPEAEEEAGADVLAALAKMGEESGARGRERLKKLRGRLNSGVDPEFALALAEIGFEHVAKGVTDVAAWLKAMKADLDDMFEEAKPYLRQVLDDAITKRKAEIRTLKATLAAGGKMDEAPQAKEEADAPLRDEVSGAPENARPRAGEGDERRWDADAARGERGGRGRGDDGADGGGGRGLDGDRRGGDVDPQSADAKPPRARRGVESPAGFTPDPKKGQPTVTGFRWPAGWMPVREGEGKKAKYQANVAAIKLLRDLEAADRLPTPEEQLTLAKYVGWGGIPEAFNYDPAWRTEIAEMRALLSPEEWTSARDSTDAAHYTSRDVIEGIYDGLVAAGFKGGRVLEPGMGTGNFLGLVPAGVRASFVGVELDGITGRIAKKLYPEADVHVESYEKVAKGHDLDGFFDLAIGNVPFSGAIKPADAVYNKDGSLNLHDWYFVKSLAKVRPGGVVAFLTSTGTLDKGGQALARMFKEADLVAAVRLPNDAFARNAGTSVTTDLVILRKRLPGEKPGAATWLKAVTKDVDGYRLPLNAYYEAHPEMLLGTPTAGSMYRAGSSFALKSDGRPIREAIAGALKDTLPKSLFKPAARQTAATLRVDVIAPPGTKVKPHALTIHEGKIVRYVDGRFVAPDLPKVKDAEVKARGLIAIRNAARDVLHAQESDATEKAIAASQAALGKIYDAFVKKHGAIHEVGNAKVFAGDPDEALLLALEVKGPKGGFAKADIFTKRLIRPRRLPESTATAKDALTAVLAHDGSVDLAKIAALAGLTPDRAAADLAGVIYEDPIAGWQTADEYLSGNIREKLRTARAAAKGEPRFDVNVAALEAVVPEAVSFENISIRLGASWVPPAVIQSFVRKLTGARYDRAVEVVYSAGGAMWDVKLVGDAQASVANTQEYFVRSSQQGAGDGKSLEDLLNDMMNFRESQIRYFVGEGESRRSVLDAKATEVARETRAKIQKAYDAWLAEPEQEALRDQLGAIYNEQFNAHRAREFDGSHLTFPGMTAGITLRPHQVNAVWRALTERRALLAHGVGAGKTFEMCAIAVEAKRLGIANKPMLVIPNHLIEQFPREFRQLYPGANILAVTEKDMAKGNRHKLMARIATGEWDAVFIPHSQLIKIPNDPDIEKAIVQGEMDDLEASIGALSAELGEREAKGNRMVKQLAKARKALASKLERLEQKIKKRQDNVVTFKQLGVDFLLVDEAHNFKNLRFATKRTRVAGLGNPEGVEKTFDMLAKVRHIQNVNAGRGIVFATGTPVTNSISEVYHMLKYLMPEEMERLGLKHFDAWAANFATTKTELVQDLSGQSYKVKTSFSEFVNAPELSAMFRQVADVQTSEMLKLDVPEAQHIAVTAKPSAELVAYTMDLLRRANALRGQRVQKGADNMLKLTGLGRTASLSMRLIDDQFPDDPGSKINLCVANVLKEYREGTGAEIRGGKADLTQMIFLDTRSPNAKRKAKPAIEEVDGDEDAEASVVEEEVEDETEAGNDSGAQEMDFTDGHSTYSPYHDVKAKLVAGGIPEDQIAFIHDAKDAKAKAALLEHVREGRIRVLLGSTPKMGEGTNVQQYLGALHHLDATWTPAGMEQRNGRIIRQGNLNAKVRIYTYATERSFDADMFQTLDRKARGIAQLMRGDVTKRVIEDAMTDTLDYGEMSALVSGNPLEKERITIEKKINTMEALETAHATKMRTMRTNLSAAEQRLAAYQDQATRQEADRDTVRAARPDPFEATLDGKVLDREAANAAFLALTGKMKPGTEKVLGAYAGLTLRAEKSADTMNRMLTSVGDDGQPVRQVEAYHPVALVARGKADHFFNLGDDTVGSLLATLRKIDHDDIADTPIGKQIERASKDIADYQEAIAKPFAEAGALEQARTRMTEIEAERKRLAAPPDPGQEATPTAPDAGWQPPDLDVEAFKASLGEAYDDVMSRPVAAGERDAVKALPTLEGVTWKPIAKLRARSLPDAARPKHEVRALAAYADKWVTGTLGGEPAYSNGHYAILGTPPVTPPVRAKNGGHEASHGTVDGGDMDRLIGSDPGTLARPIVVASAGKEQMAALSDGTILSAPYLGWILGNFPDAKLFTRGEGPVVARQGEQVVGLVMPIKARDGVAARIAEVVRAFVEGETGSFDINKLVPQPKRAGKTPALSEQEQSAIDRDLDAAFTPAPRVGANSYTSSRRTDIDDALDHLFESERGNRFDNRWDFLKAVAEKLSPVSKTRMGVDLYAVLVQERDYSDAEPGTVETFVIGEDGEMDDVVVYPDVESAGVALKLPYTFDPETFEIEYKVGTMPREDKPAAAPAPDAAQKREYEDAVLDMMRRAGGRPGAVNMDALLRAAAVGGEAAVKAMTRQGLRLMRSEDGFWMPESLAALMEALFEPRATKPAGKPGDKRNLPPGATPRQPYSDIKAGIDFGKLEEKVDRVKEKLVSARLNGADPKTIARLEAGLRKLRDELVEMQTNALATKRWAMKAAARITPGYDPKTIAGPEIYAGEKYTPGAQGFNVRRLDTDDDVLSMLKGFMREAAKQVDAVSDGNTVATHAGTEAEAARRLDTGELTVEAIMDLDPNTPVDRVTLTAARMVMVTIAEEVTQLARAITAGNATDRDKFDFLRLNELLGHVAPIVRGISRETARALSAHNIQAKSAAGVAKAIEGMLQQYGPENIGRLADAIAQLDDPVAVARRAPRPQRTDTPLHKLAEYWLMAILSGIPTHLRNIGGSIFNLGAYVTDTATAAGLGAARGRALDERHTLGEAGAMMHELLVSLPDAWRIAHLSFDRNEPMSGVSQMDRHARAWDPNTKVGEVIGTPGRFLMMEDEFFKYLFKRMSLAQQATQLAHKRGKTGAAFDAEVVKLLNNPTAEMEDGAAEMANYQTFQKASGRFMAGVARAKHDHPLWAFLVPFIKTPANMLKYATEHSIAAPLMPSVKAEMDAGGLRRDLALAKMTTGTIFMGVMATAALAGMLTGSGPDDRDERRLLMQTGWRPYALRLPLGDGRFAYIPYNQATGAAGLLIGAVADAAETWREAQDPAKDMSEVGRAVFGGALQLVRGNILEQTMWRGVQDAVEVVYDPQRFIQGYLSNMAASFVPNFVAKAVEAGDYQMRDTRGDGIMDEAWRKVQARLPVAAQELPQRHDMFGRPMEKSALNRASQIGLPFNPGVSKGDKMLDEMLRLKESANKTGKRLGIAGKVEVPLSIDERREVEINRGRLFEKYGRRYVEDPDFVKRPDFQQKLIIDKIRAKTSEAGGKQFIGAHQDEMRERAYGEFRKMLDQKNPRRY